MSIIAAHWGGEHTAEAWWSSSELEWITSFLQCSLPTRHTGDGLPGLGPRGKGWNGSADWLHKGREALWEAEKEVYSLLKMFVYFVRYHSGRTPGRRSRPVRNRKQIFLCTQHSARWREAHERPFAGWSGGSETRAPPPSAWLIRKTSLGADPRRS